MNIANLEWLNNRLSRYNQHLSVNDFTPNGRLYRPNDQRRFQISLKGSSVHYIFYFTSSKLVHNFDNSIGQHYITLNDICSVL